MFEEEKGEIIFVDVGKILDELPRFSRARTGFPSAQADFSWCNENSEDCCAQSVDQHILQYCGFCWSQAMISV